MAMKKTTRRNVVKYAAVCGVGFSVLGSVPVVLRYISPSPDWPLPPGQVKPGPIKVADLKDVSPGSFLMYNFNFGKVTLVGGLWYLEGEVSHQRKGATQADGKNMGGGPNENKGLPNEIVSYCLLCTHLGCIPKNWEAETKILLCPCHNGMYDISNGASVVSGPPPAAIPEIILEKRDEEIWAVDWKDADYVKSLDVYKNKGAV
jgi:Rieske Fe-S protein